MNERDLVERVAAEHELTGRHSAQREGTHQPQRSS
jgi:hypothetical protein